MSTYEWGELESRADYQVASLHLNGDLIGRLYTAKKPNSHWVFAFATREKNRVEVLDLKHIPATDPPPYEYAVGLYCLHEGE